jgi:hypothetical protein
MLATHPRRHRCRNSPSGTRNSARDMRAVVDCKPRNRRPVFGRQLGGDPLTRSERVRLIARTALQAARIARGERSVRPEGRASRGGPAHQAHHQPGRAYQRRAVADLPAGRTIKSAQALSLGAVPAGERGRRQGGVPGAGGSAAVAVCGPRPRPHQEIRKKSALALPLGAVAAGGIGRRQGGSGRCRGLLEPGEPSAAATAAASSSRE